MKIEKILPFKADYPPYKIIMISALMLIGILLSGSLILLFSSLLVKIIMLCTAALLLLGQLLLFTNLFYINYSNSKSNEDKYDVTDEVEYNVLLNEDNLSSECDVFDGTEYNVLYEALRKAAGEELECEDGFACKEECYAWLEEQSQTSLVCALIKKLHKMGYEITTK